MGQYYIPTFLRKRKARPQLIPESGIHPHRLMDGLKLGECGWAYSPTMFYTETKLMGYGDKGSHFAYAGDYEPLNPNVAVTQIGDGEIESNTYNTICKQAFDLTYNDFSSDKYAKWKNDRVLFYFVNHDKKQYVHLNITFTEDEISPLAFLCYAGDKYDQFWYGCDREDKLIGLWAYDRVAIVNEIPKDYENIEPK